MSIVSIPVHQGYPGYVSPEHHEQVLEYRWCVKPGRNTYYLKSSIGSLHRFIMKLQNIEIPRRLIVDHIDGRGFCCTKENLRIISVKENAANRHDPTKFWGGIKKNIANRWSYLDAQYNIWMGNYVRAFDAAKMRDYTLTAAGKRPENFPETAFGVYNWDGSRRKPRIF